MSGLEAGEQVALCRTRMKYRYQDKDYFGTICVDFDNNFLAGVIEEFPEAGAYRANTPLELYKAFQSKVERYLEWIK